MRIPVLVLLLVTAGAAGCARCNAPEVPEASAPPAPPPPAPVIKDAGPDVTDARSDASDAAPAGPPHHAAKKPAPAAGGGGGINVEGSLQKPDAEKIVRAGFARLRACSPDAKGRVTFRLTIDARGRVTLGEVVTSTLAGDDAEMCMIRATRDFKFPAASGESTVTFPMNFGR